MPRYILLLRSDHNEIVKLGPEEMQAILMRFNKWRASPSRRLDGTRRVRNCATKSGAS